MNVAVIDDSKQDFEKLEIYLRKYCESHCFGVSVFVDCYQDEELFLAEFKRDKYDFIFIDYYLNNRTGLEVAKEIRKSDTDTLLIFTTVSSDFAIETYKVKASGYLVKPIKYNEFEEIMSLMDYKKIRDSAFIEICSGGENIKIIVKDIIYCDVQGHYIQIHMKNKQIYKCRNTFSMLSDKLIPYKEFLSCYKGCAINMNQIKEVGELEFHMLDGELISFCKKKKAKIMEIYHDFLFQNTRRCR